MLLAGLSDQSRWRAWARDRPVEVTGYEAVQQVIDRL